MPLDDDIHSVFYSSVRVSVSPMSRPYGDHSHSRSWGIGHQGSAQEPGHRGTDHMSAGTHGRSPDTHGGTRRMGDAGFLLMASFIKFPSL